MAHGKRILLISINMTMLHQTIYDLAAFSRAAVNGAITTIRFAVATRFSGFSSLSQVVYGLDGGRRFEMRLSWRGRRPKYDAATGVAVTGSQRSALA
jgi:hypothetical protein